MCYLFVNNNKRNLIMNKQLKINELQNSFNNNLNIINKALLDEDYINDYIDFNNISVKQLYLNDNIKDEDKVKSFIEYVEKDVHIAYYYLFLMYQKISDKTLFEFKQYFLKGSKTNHNFISFLYGLYTLDIFFNTKKESELLKAQQLLEKAYNNGIVLAKPAIENITIFSNINELKSNIGEMQPIKKQILINNKERDVYLFTGVVIDRKIINSQNTTTTLNHDYSSTSTSIQTNTTNSFIVSDDYGNEKNYVHTCDISIRKENRVTIISLDNPDNNVGIYNKDNKYVYYRMYDIKKIIPLWYKMLTFLFIFIGFYIFPNFLDWDYGTSTIGFAIIMIIYIFTISKMHKFKFNQFKKEMWKHL